MKKKPKVVSFRCFVCNAQKQRGTMVQVLRGPFKGCVIKVCKDQECQKPAQRGAFAVVA